MVRSCRMREPRALLSNDGHDSGDTTMHPDDLIRHEPDGDCPQLCELTGRPIRNDEPYRRNGEIVYPPGYSNAPRLPTARRG